MIKQTFYIAKDYYKKPVEGEIIEYEERKFGIYEDNYNWLIADILTGFIVNIEPLYTEKDAIKHIKKYYSEFMKRSTIKLSEKLFERLPIYDKNTIYITEIKYYNFYLVKFNGEYDSREFITTINFITNETIINYGEFTKEECIDILKQIKINYLKGVVI